MRKQFVVRGMVFEAEETEITKVEEAVLGAIAAGEQAYKEIEALRRAEPALAKFLFGWCSPTRAATIMRNLVDARKYNDFEFIGYIKELNK